jgi:RNA polymerase subunit RPABC4/transcription elongation factor Spt4
LTFNEFRLSYFWICKEMNLANKHRDLLLKYLKRLLPSNNKLPNSYKTLKKDVNEYSFQKYKVCVDCAGKISNNNCPNCFSNNTSKQVDAAVFDFETQLTDIYIRNTQEILKYKGIFILSR